MIYVQLILLLSLAAYVACTTYSWSKNNDKQKIKNQKNNGKYRTVTYNNDGKVTKMQMNDGYNEKIYNMGEQIYNMGEQVYNQGEQVYNQEKPGFYWAKRDLNQAKWDMDQAKQDVKRDLNQAKWDRYHAKQDIDHAKQDIYHAKQDIYHAKQDIDQAKQNRFQAKQDRKQAKQDRYQAKQARNQAKQDFNQDTHVFNQGRHVFNQGKQTIHGKQIFYVHEENDNTIKPHTDMESQKKTKSNYQDQGVDLGEIPSSKSIIPNICPNTDGGNENEQYNNFGTTVKPHTHMESQEKTKSNYQDEGVDLGEIPSSNSNTANICPYTDGGNENEQYNNFGTTDLFEEGDLIVFRVGLDDPTMYWMVVEKYRQYQEPSLDDVYFTIKPCQNDYQEVLDQLTESENDQYGRRDYVHIKNYGMYDEDERD